MWEMFRRWKMLLTSTYTMVKPSRSSRMSLMVRATFSSRYGNSFSIIYARPIYYYNYNEMNEQYWFCKICWEKKKLSLLILSNIFRPLIIIFQTMHMGFFFLKIAWASFLFFYRILQRWQQGPSIAPQGSNPLSFPYQIIQLILITFQVPFFFQLKFQSPIPC